MSEDADAQSDGGSELPPPTLADKLRESGALKPPPELAAGHKPSPLPSGLKGPDMAKLISQADGMKRLQEQITGVTSAVSRMQPAVKFDVPVIPPHVFDPPRIEPIDNGYFEYAAERKRQEHDALLALPEILTAMNVVLHEQVRSGLAANEAEEENAWHTKVVGVIAVGVATAALVTTEFLWVRLVAALVAGVVTWLAMTVLQRARRAWLTRRATRAERAASHAATSPRD